MNKINAILEEIMTLNSDDTAKAEVIVGVRRDTGEAIGAGFTEEIAMGCSLYQYNKSTGADTYEKERANEADAHSLVSLVKVPLW